MTVENKHWKDTDSDLFTFAWASHIVVASLTDTILSPQQQDSYSDWLTRSKETGIRSLKLRFEPDIAHWGLSFVLQAEDEETAIKSTATAALDGLAYAGVDLETLEHVGNHLVYFETLKSDVETARAAGKSVPNITNREYYVLDEDFAHDAFLKARDFYVEVATLLG